MRVAVVGGGIAGMAAAWALQDFADVTLFEAQPRLGGHTDTHNVLVGGRTYAVDSGFIVFNRTNYPRFSAWLDELGVASRPSDMSFAVRRERDDGTAVEYGTSSLGALFCRRGNLFSPRFLSMLDGIRRFYRDAARVAADDPRTLGTFLDARRYSPAFVDDHLLPMCAALWSAPLDAVRDLSIAHVAVFMANHGLLRLRGRPAWRVVEGGSSAYVEAFARRFRGRRRVGARVERVERGGDGVGVATADGAMERFDRVVFACHADQALALIDAGPVERDVLGALRYRRNRAVVHSDPSAMPHRRAAWSSWNVTAAGRGGAARCRVTYWMNRLQGIADGPDFFVTLNPPAPLRRVWIERDYAHPVFTPAARRAQRRRAEVSGVNRTFYCGAYWGWGFHEDGFRSGVDAAEALRREVRDAA